MMELWRYAFSPLLEGDFTLYRGSCNGMAPILLVAAEDASPWSSKRLEHEYGLKAELDVTWAARPVALSRYNDRLALVREDPGGEPLGRLLGRPLGVSEFLHIAIPLATALRGLHERGLIHKDIKPANVLVDIASGGVWLTGFGIASRLPREHQNPEPAEAIDGTLAYMAPEQTGRMNRSIDSRSDLYSLGITFYEMLTGSLPFSAAEPIEWIHCHIARQAYPPDERAKEIPKVLSSIVMKLLAKTAEERYQTTAGVEADLRRCLAEWKSQGRIEPFPLGAHDASDRLLIPEKLYGREREINSLLAAFDRVVAQGTAELVLVSGYSGIGKSSVVKELHKVLVPPRGLFASGKFDQYKRDIPYATLGQAFQSLVRSLLTQSEKELGRWRDSLREALGTNGQLIVNLVPELELVIGKQPPVADLPPQDVHNRFQMVFRRFLGVFASPEHPLALFLDDLQWLDVATLDLFEHLVTHPEVRHLLLVGAYRDNEVGPAHPLLRTLEAIRAVDARVHEIVLAPLELHDVGKLVADALHCQPERAAPLAELAQEKTGGNPFFAIQFFISLADEGLLAFDRAASAWQWNINRIHAKSYTDNVVDLMAGKLKRLSATTQEALKQLACLGNITPTATLAMVHGTTEEAIHAALWEAVRAGIVFRQEGAYKFLHDRIQQAAYSLIAEGLRAEAHLRIGRVLLGSITADDLAEHLFDVANHFNRGATLLVDRDEKTEVAAIDLRAGRKAKVSAAYASACVYLAAGMVLLDERCWSSQYELMFSLWRERAECEFLTGNFDTAEQLIGELSQRAASTVDQAAAYHLKVLIHTVKSESAQAVACALTCLRLFGIDIPAHPTWDQVQAEYQLVWQPLSGRPIEGLIDLPLMTDPELQAAMRVLSDLLPPAYFTDFHLFCLLVCRMVNVSTQHGMCGASARGCAYFGAILGQLFHRFSEGYRFAKLACDLVAKHGFIASQAKVYFVMGIVAFWTQPIPTAIDFMQAAFRTAIETGDLTYACYSRAWNITGLLVRNDPLDAVWRESEKGLEFIRKVSYRDMEDIVVSQQRFIASMQGRTATFSTFSDEQFDETAFEAQLTGDRMPMLICWYWILKLKARFLSGDYAEALAAADKAKALLWASTLYIQLFDYFCYTALTVAALYENASADQQNRWRELLTAHREQLSEWADNYPPTFAGKHALVLAEIARLEGRDADAMRLYEQAIRSAHEHGFVQNEGLAHEVAAKFCAARGFETIAHAYLRNARSCYLRWGALGKVRQLEQLHPKLLEDATPPPPATAGTPVDQFDIGAVVKASQAVSGEIVLDRLIETLMTIALEHAGAERGLLILLRGDTLQIEAEARTDNKTIEVTLRQEKVTPAAVPEAVLHTVIRTQHSVILDDASALNPFAADAYVRQTHARSVLCLPLIKQAKLIGVLYLENSLASHVFTPARISVLELLASQAAISLENARLYGDLAEREAKIRRLIDANIIGIFIWNFDGEILEANDAFLRIVGYDRQDLTADRIRWTDLTPPEFRDHDELAQREILTTSIAQPHEKEFVSKDGLRVPVLIGAANFEADAKEGVAFVLDISERKRAEVELRESEQNYRMLFEAIDEGFCTIEVLFDQNEKPVDYRFLQINPSFERQTGIKNAAGKRMREIAPQHEEHWFEIYGRIALTGEPMRFENEAKRLGRWYDVYAFRVEDPKRRRVGILFNDITDRKRAEEDLRRSEASLTQAQRISHTGSWRWNVGTGAVSSSAELLHIFGFDPTAAPPSYANFMERIHLEDRPSFEQVLDQAVREKSRFQHEYRIALPDGSVKYLQSVGQPDSTESSDLEFVGTVMDMTVRRHAEEALRNAQAELIRVARLTTMGELLASIAHEINQPLAAVATSGGACLRWLNRNQPDLASAREAALRVVRDAHRAGDVIRSLRALTQKSGPQLTQLDIHDAIAEVLALTHGELQRHGVVLHTDLAAGDRPVLGDRVQLQQVMLNLIMNGIHAMGAVTDRKRELTVSVTRAEPDHVHVAVADTGLGLDPTIAQRIFEPFFTTKSDGLGMGLSICRSIIEAHGGQLWASPRAPHGTAFHFTIPMSVEV